MKRVSSVWRNTIYGYAGNDVFKNKAEKEKTWRFRPRYLTPIPLYLNYQRIRHEDWEEEKQTYFSKNPSFEQWCDDVFKEIKNHYWYKKHRPDYSKEEFLEDLAYPYIEREMRYYYEKKEMPIEMAGGWDLINM
jgi:hypothetical protein